MNSIEQEFAYAKAQGWIPLFEKAAADYGFDTATLMAIASRESDMRNIVGDGGHGYSLMQIDDRSYPTFCHSSQWRNVALAIQKGSQVLDEKRMVIEHSQGTRLLVGGRPFVGASVKDPATLLRLSIASYNAGMWPYYCFSKNQDPDRLTTGRNYSKDVLNRRQSFAALLKGA